MLAGTVAGALLALLVTRVVSVTARAAAPGLPLQTSFDLRVVAIAAAVYLLVAAALVALATRRAFRGDRGPARAQGGGHMSLVEARDLFGVYPGSNGGVAALQGLTLDVDEGEICVVLGPSGSGKTTLMRVLAGFERASAGSIVVSGASSSGRCPSGAWPTTGPETLGYADQHYWRALAGELTAEELVAVPLGSRAPGSPSALRAPTAFSSESACATGQVPCRVSSPVASSSGSPSVPRWRTGRAC